MSYTKEIGSLVSGPSALGALYLGLSVAVIADMLPHPMDAVYFHYQKQNRDKFISKEITPQQYWRRNVISYYAFDAIWWAFLLIVALSIKGKAKDKLMVVGILIGLGAVIAVIHKNIKKDIEEQSKL